jgi:membrane-associated protein
VAGPAYAARMAGFVEGVLTEVPTWLVYVTVFVLPFVECSLFVGFVFPGETALLLGGVLAAEGKVSVVAVCVLAVLGAVLGDSAGYLVGRRYGAAVQRSRLGRVVGEPRWRVAEAFLLRRGGPAVFLGRFTALLRALVPSAAGMSGLRYRTFLLWNAVGGIVWGTGAVLAGYLAGASYRRVESYLGKGALALTGAVVLALVVAHLVRRHRGRPTMVEQYLEVDQPDLTSDPSGR